MGRSAPAPRGASIRTIRCVRPGRVLEPLQEAIDRFCPVQNLAVAACGPSHSVAAASAMIAQLLVARRKAVLRRKPLVCLEPMTTAIRAMA